MIIQLVADLRHGTHELVGFAGYICLVIGVLMLLFSLMGGRFQGDKVMRAGIMIVAGAVLMNLVENYL